MTTAQKSHIQNILFTTYDAERLAQIESTLNHHGTINFKIKDNGLYSAVTTDHDMAQLASGYSYTWVRDTVAASVNKIELGQWNVAHKTLRTLEKYFAKHQNRFIDIIHGTADKNDPMQRPHIRFNGDTLEEIDQKWSHAQNDALGYALWLFGKLALNTGYNLTGPSMAIWSLFPFYFRAIEYWQDADNGHWEETAKIESSSIGTAMAGLKIFKEYCIQQNIEKIQSDCNTMTMNELDDLIAKGQEQLNEFLPWETAQGFQNERKADSATLFLIYPLNVVTDAQANEIIKTVTTDLQGEHGIKRYLGDSYWCADYKKLMSADELTTCTGQKDRDKHLIPGTEAQWCIFDPILSVIYGQRYLKDKNPENQALQTHYFNRALSQITPDFKCPEAYYIENSQNGLYVPNDQTPLVWTQANLGIALEYMKRTHGVV